MEIKSTAFASNQTIPTDYTCDGKNIIPPLSFSQIPAEAKSLALIFHDPDAVSGDFVHWILWNIPASTTEISDANLPTFASMGKNDFGKLAYGGPCPPPGKIHHYTFELYALDSMLDLKVGADIYALKSAMKLHKIAKAKYIGLYSRS